MIDIDELRKRRKKKQEAVSMNKEEVNSMYDNIKLDTLKQILSDVDWYIKSDERECSDELHFIESVYGKTALAGLTDYKDHRDDELETLKQKTLEQIENRTMQKGHYYDKDGNPFDGVLLVGNNSGWSAYCLFSENNDNGYFEFMRK